MVLSAPLLLIVVDVSIDGTLMAGFILALITFLSVVLFINQVCARRITDTGSVCGRFKMMAGNHHSLNNQLFRLWPISSNNSIWICWISNSRLYCFRNR